MYPRKAITITAIVPNDPIIVFIHTLHISPTAPPQGNVLFPKITDAVTLIKGSPTIKYFTFLKIENIFLLKNKFTPITKNSEQNK